MTNKPIPENNPNAELYTDQIGELRFRQLAGLCEHCGRSRTMDGSNICETCNEQRRSSSELTIPRRRVAA